MISKRDIAPSGHKCLVRQTRRRRKNQTPQKQKTKTKQTKYYFKVKWIFILSTLLHYNITCSQMR